MPQIVRVVVIVSVTTRTVTTCRRREFLYVITSIYCHVATCRSCRTRRPCTRDRSPPRPRVVQITPIWTRFFFYTNVNIYTYCFSLKPGTHVHTVARYYYVNLPFEKTTYGVHGTGWIHVEKGYGRITLSTEIFWGDSLLKQSWIWYNSVLLLLLIL